MEYTSYDISANNNSGSWVLKYRISTLYFDVKTFDELLEYIKEQKAYYEANYVENTTKAKLLWFGTYEDLRFTSIELDCWGVDDDGHRQTHIIGVREPTAEELEYLEKYRKEQELKTAEYRRQQYLKLKEEFENVIFSNV